MKRVRSGVLGKSMKIHNMMVASLVPVVFASVAFGQVPVERPELSVGDRWSYVERDVVPRQESKSTREIESRQESAYVVRDSNEDVKGVSARTRRLSLHLNRLRTINGQTSDSGWFQFPLVPGKKYGAKELWVNSAGDSGYDDMTYAVVGTEKVTVPAGTFDTVKVEGEGRWYNTSVNRSDKKTVTLWYAPEAKAMIRFYQQEWNRGAVNSEGTMELVGARIMKDGTMIGFGTVQSGTLPIAGKDAGVATTQSK
jgi:hypothetical protein